MPLKKSPISEKTVIPPVYIMQLLKYCLFIHHSSMDLDSYWPIVQLLQTVTWRKGGRAQLSGKYLFGGRSSVLSSVQIGEWWRDWRCILLRRCFLAWLEGIDCLHDIVVDLWGTVRFSQAFLMFYILLARDFFNIDLIRLLTLRFILIFLIKIEIITVNFYDSPKCPHEFRR